MDHAKARVRLMISSHLHLEIDKNDEITKISSVNTGCFEKGFGCHLWEFVGDNGRRYFDDIVFWQLFQTSCRWLMSVCTY